MAAMEGGRCGARPAGFDDHPDALADEAGVWDDGPPEYEPDDGDRPDD